MNKIKNTNFFGPLMAILAVLCFMACDNEPLEGEFSDVPPTPDDTTDVEESFQVNLDSLLVVGQTVYSDFDGDMLTITAYQGTKRVVLNIPNPAIDTFDLETQQAWVVYTPNYAVDTLEFNSTKGTLSITDFDSLYVSGAFSGELYETEADSTIKMTSGLFKNIGVNVPDPIENSATALVNGIAFTASTFSHKIKNGQLILNFGNDLNEEIELILPQDVIASTNSVTNPPSDYSAIYTAFENATPTEYYSVFDSGEISITSYEGGLIVGTFYFDAQTSSGNETVSVTEGSFVLNLD